MSKFNYPKMKKITYKIFFIAMIFISIKDPVEILIYNIISNNLKYSKVLEGKLDIKLFQNYPTQLEKTGNIVTIYKSEDQKAANLKKINTKSDIWFTSDENLQVFSNKNQDNLVGVGNCSSSGTFLIVSNSSSLVKINNLEHKDGGSLLILTKHEYYNDIFKNTLGVSLGFGCFLFFFVVSYFTNKKIDERSENKKIDERPEKKKIILLS